jgi:hypothetical protein
MYAPVSQDEADRWLTSGAPLVHQLQTDLGIEEQDVSGIVTAVRAGDVRILDLQTSSRVEEKQWKTAIVAVFLEEFQRRFRSAVSGEDLGLQSQQLQSLDRLSSDGSYIAVLSAILDCAFGIAQKIYASLFSESKSDHRLSKLLSYMRSSTSVISSAHAARGKHPQETLYQKIAVGQRNAYEEIFRLAKAAPFSYGEVRAGAPPEYFNECLVPPVELCIVHPHIFAMQRMLRYMPESVPRDPLARLLRRSVRHARDMAHCGMGLFSVYDHFRFREILTDSRHDGFMGLSDGARTGLTEIYKLVKADQEAQKTPGAEGFSMPTVRCPAEYARAESESGTNSPNLIVDQFNHYHAMIDRWILGDLDAIWQRTVDYKRPQTP